jgi:putative hydrolase of the HAD superfamily
MMMIFFDIDETLIDQRRAEAVAAARFLESYGARLPRHYSVPEFCRLWRELREKHAPAFHRGEISFAEQRRRRLRDLFGDAEPGLSDCELDSRLAAYLEPYRQSWSLFADVPACLARLSGRPLGVISNGSQAQQYWKLKQTGIHRYFQVIVISEAAGIAKPERGIFLAACRQAGVRPENCTYVGDRLEVDARGSRAAGMRGIWLNRHDAKEPPDMETIRSLAELEAHLAPDRSHT